MEESEEFLGDLREGITKAGQILKYLLELVVTEAGRTKHKNETKTNTNFKILENTKIAKCSNFPKEEDENMKNIRQRKDGRWEFRLQYNNKRYDIICKTLKELKAKIKGFKKNLKSGGSATALKNHMFVDFSNYWFNTFKSPSIGDKTAKMYEDTLKYFNELNMEMADIRTTHLQEFLNKFPPTRTKEILYMTIKQIFRKALELKLVKEDVSQFLVKGRIERTQREIICFDDQQKLVQHLQGKTDMFSMAMYVYLLTGCRPLEINCIRKKDIDDNLLFINGTKTKNSKRLVRISSKFSNMLKTYSQNMKPDDHLFKFTYDTLKNQFDSLREALQINGSLYCLRHTYSTNTYYLGASDKERQASMGHASSAMTNDVYTHIDFKLNKKNLSSLYGDLYPDFTDK